MPSYVFLDTNNWIYLANGFNIYSNKHDDLHLKVFDLIEKWADDGSIVFLVNELVLQEFERNKVQTEAKIKDIQAKADGYLNSLKPVKDFLQDEEPELHNLQEKIKFKAEQRVAQQKTHIVKVENFLLNKTTQIPITDQHHLAAAKMAIEKRAPFVGEKKNSMADALLMLSFVDYMLGIGIQKIDFGDLGDPIEIEDFPASYFVSSNSGDFSDPKEKEVLHPDLIPIMGQSQSKFYYVLHKLVNEIEAQLLTREEEEAIEDAEDWIHCDVCDNEFSHIDFSQPFQLFDPHIVKGGSRDKDQLPLFEDFEVKIEKPFVTARTAECDQCGTDFLECPNCETLIVIDDYNTKIPCTDCDYKFILHAERDRKGMICEGEYEIAMDFRCGNCGNEVDSVSESGICEICQAYEDSAEAD